MPITNFPKSLLVDQLKEEGWVSFEQLESIAGLHSLLPASHRPQKSIPIASKALKQRKVAAWPTTSWRLCLN